MPILEELPLEEKVRRGNVLLQDAAARRRGNAAAVDQRRRPGRRRGGHRRRRGSRSCGRSPTTSSTCWRIATRGTGTSSKRRRGRWPSTGCRPNAGASCGSSRCRPRSSPDGSGGLPLFASVSVDELFRIAGASRQVRHEPGTSPPAGGASCRRRSTSCSTAGSRAAERVPGRRATDRVARGARLRAGAAGPSDAQIDADDRERRHAGDHRRRAAHAARGQHRAGAGTVRRRSPSASMPRRSATCSRRGPPASCEQLAAGGLLPIEKVLALQRVPVFSRIAVEEMRPLAEIAQTVPMTMGSPLFAESAPPALWLVLSGEVSLEDAEGPSARRRAPATSSDRAACCRAAARPIRQRATQRARAAHRSRRSVRSPRSAAGADAAAVRGHVRDRAGRAWPGRPRVRSTG